MSREILTYERVYVVMLNKLGVKDTSYYNELDTPAEVGRFVEESLLAGRRISSIYVRDRIVE